MPSHHHPISLWSDPLAHALLSTISDNHLNALLPQSKEDTWRKPDGKPRAWREQLVAQARQRKELRGQIMHAWRQSNADLVFAAEQISIDGSPQHREALLLQFDSRRILLELITDEYDEGWEFARWVVDNIDHEPRRKEFMAILDDWSVVADNEGEGDGESLPAGRVVIFGGHTRDPRKMTSRLVQGARLDVRWKTCDKDQGAPEFKMIREWMASADAAIVITSKVSHNVMKSVRQYAQKNDIPFRAVEKASESQLLAALAELFSGA